jgi:hypothetical protein
VAAAAEEEERGEAEEEGGEAVMVTKAIEAVAVLEVRAPLSPWLITTTTVSLMVGVTVSVCVPPAELVPSAAVPVSCGFAVVDDPAPVPVAPCSPSVAFASAGSKHPTCTPFVLSMGMAKHLLPSCLQATISNEPSVRHVATWPSMQAIWLGEQADCGVRAPKRSLKALASARLAEAVALPMAWVVVGMAVSMVGTAPLGVPVGVMVDEAPVPVEEPVEVPLEEPAKESADEPARLVSLG